LNSPNLVFTAPTVEGTAGRDVIIGTATSEVIYGLAGKDHIDGGIGSDLIIGGTGAHLLIAGGDPNLSVYRRNGTNDADVFRYTAATDSYRSQSFVDLIARFADNDDKAEAGNHSCGIVGGRGGVPKVSLLLLAAVIQGSSVLGLQRLLGHGKMLGSDAFSSKCLLFLFVWGLSQCRTSD
jgi:hypothetical protein